MLQAVPKDPDHITDEEREAMIRYAEAQMNRAYNRDDIKLAHHYEREMRDLIKQRTPEQVARMEAKGGLR